MILPYPAAADYGNGHDGAAGLGGDLERTCVERKELIALGITVSCTLGEDAYRDAALYKIDGFKKHVHSGAGLFAVKELAV